jgi:hypothetical protein
MFNQGSDLGMEYTPYEEVAQMSDDFRAVDFIGSQRSDYPHPVNKVVAEFCGLFDSPTAVFHTSVLPSGVQTFYFSDVAEDAFASVTAMNYNVKGVRLSYGFEFRPYGFPPSGAEYVRSTKVEFIAALNEFYKQFLPF